LDDSDSRLLGLRLIFDEQPRNIELDELSYFLERKQFDKAKKYVASILRKGNPDKEFLSLAADLIDPETAPKMGVGRPTNDPFDFVNRRISMDFAELTGRGNFGRKSPRPASYEQAIRALSDEYAKSERTIESIIAFFENRRGRWSRQLSDSKSNRLQDKLRREKAKELRNRLPEKHYDAEIVTHFRIVFAKKNLDDENERLLKDAAIKLLQGLCIHSCKDQCRKGEFLEGRRACKKDHHSEGEFTRATAFILENVAFPYFWDWN
jgi:hypothetical protein